MDHSINIQNRLEGLFEKYLDNTLTKEEFAEFWQLLKEQKEGGLEEGLRRLWTVSSEAPYSLPAEEWEWKMNWLRRKVDEDQVKSKNSGRLVAFLQQKWVAVAVVVFLVLGLWFLVGRNRGEKPSVALSQTERFKNDVAPGREGAILTLADGRQIVLDSAGNGTLTQQGAADVSKQGNQLVYDQQGKAVEAVYNTMSTPKGRQYSLVLSDGSKVWLNAASSIRFPTAFSGTTRVVEITGEAYFEVAHNPQKPFIVAVNDMQVEVLGTHFNINAYSDEPEVRTTLLEGKVRVSSNGEAVIINPGEQARLTTNHQLQTTNLVDLDEVMAWKNGLFQFKSTDIKTIMRQLERWYDLDVQYEGTVTDAFNGTLPRTVSAATVFKVLELTGGVKFKIEGRKVTVTP